MVAFLPSGATSATLDTAEKRLKSRRRARTTRRLSMAMFIMRGMTIADAATAPDRHLRLYGVEFGAINHKNVAHFFAEKAARITNIDGAAKLAIVSGTPSCSLSSIAVTPKKSVKEEGMWNHSWTIRSTGYNHAYKMRARNMNVNNGSILVGFQRGLSSVQNNYIVKKEALLFANMIDI
uniref:Uncharacterized protein n=1 Tax=Romanomermis culicivorax TaxID=13658 RepID=A0A915HKF3_ROMCU